ELARRFLHGQRLALGREALLTAGGRVRVYGDGRFLGTGQLAAHGVLAPERLIATGFEPQDGSSDRQS
ncbi:MAG: tRNA pseudouridine(55) synthase TruB, partial [Burkholderiaceae bacterium]